VISIRFVFLALVSGFSVIAFSVYYVLYCYSITDNIIQIETANIGSNTEIETKMISKIFAKSVESVVDNLRLISNSPSVQNGDSSGIDLLGLAERNTGNLTDFYIWLDGEGKIDGSSSAIDGTNEQLAKDLSNTQIFSVPKTTLG
jgi:hypothetical protein